jgi:hypothetical protein
VGCEVEGVDEDDIEIHDNTDVQHIRKDAVDKTLKGRWSISESLGYDQPFVGPITGPERGFPLIALGHPDEMISGA